jgi:putative glutamine amidotransferase
VADGLVVTDASRDVHAALYGQTRRPLRGEPDLASDRLDLALVNAALALDMPMVCACHGHQLLNIASDRDLYQDVIRDGASSADHCTGHHLVQTYRHGAMRELVGRCAEVQSDHHQAVRRLGRRLEVTASLPDGLIETIERTDKQFALGLQWHPENDRGGPSDRVAEALVAAAVERAA